MKRIRYVWTTRNYVTIDNIILKYMIRDVTYVQYISAKPIKHGIKVFAIFCALSTIILGFKVYVGQEDDSNNTALGICDDMVKEAGLTNARGRTLYTNKYYMSMALANYMFNKYGWITVGNIVQTDKKSRADRDICFLKFSNGSSNGLQ